MTAATAARHVWLASAHDTQRLWLIDQPQDALQKVGWQLRCVGHAQRSVVVTAVRLLLCARHALQAHCAHAMAPHLLPHLHCHTHVCVPLLQPSATCCVLCVSGAAKRHWRCRRLVGQNMLQKPWL
jgi:hypothetical protein